MDDYAPSAGASLASYRAMAKRTQRRWSGGRETRESHALSLDPRVSAKRTPRGIAVSLKRSADGSRARKSSRFRSAMSMLNLYINRAGSRLSAKPCEVLECAKDGVRALYGRNPHAGKAYR